MAGEGRAVLGRVGSVLSSRLQDERAVAAMDPSVQRRVPARHTFCSHLAMRGAPAKAIQELAGHQDLTTTQQYMHLSPAALDAAIRLLETGTDTGRVAVEK